MRAAIRSLSVRTSFKLALVLLPWLMLIWQNYVAFYFPIKTDRYQHSFSEHLRDRGVAYLQLLRSPFKVTNLGMEAEAVAQIVRETSRKYNVDPCLIESIVIYESDFNPNNISTTGAMGLMALMPITTKQYGVPDPFNAASNVDGGTRLVRDLLETFNGDVDLTLAGYNAGDRAVRQFKGVPPYRETTDYVKFVGEIYELLKLRSEYITNGKSGAISSHVTNTYDDHLPTSRMSQPITCSPSATHWSLSSKGGR
jgi:hypothetical protein